MKTLSYELIASEHQLSLKYIFLYLPIVQKHSSHVELAISPAVGKSSSLDLACFVQAPEGVWTRAMFGTSSTKSDSSIFIKLLASRTFLAHFALNLKWSPIVLCLKVPSRPKSFEDLIFNIYGSNWPSLSSVGHLLHIFGPLSTHKLVPIHFSSFLRRTPLPTFEETNQFQECIIAGCLCCIYGMVVQKNKVMIMSAGS